jgi:hypothetical protein
MEADLTELAGQAEQRGDQATLASALSYLAYHLRFTGDTERPLLFGRQAVQAAEKSAETRLIIDALCALGSAHAVSRDFEPAQECLRAARNAAQPTDPFQQLSICRLEFDIYYRLEQYLQLRQITAEGIRLARLTGQRAIEAFFTNGISIANFDLALTGNLPGSSTRAGSGCGGPASPKLYCCEQQCGIWQITDSFSGQLKLCRRPCKPGANSAWTQERCTI